MDGALGERLLFVGIVVAFLIVFSLMRSRNPVRIRSEIVRTLLAEIRINTILVDTFERQPVARRFEVTGWQLHRKKAGFLDKTLLEDLGATFGTAVDYNRRLKTARKSKSADPVPLDHESMKAPLLRVKQGLEDWLLANVGSIDQSERPGMIDGLFGR
jgi:hypothetical protein